MYTEDGILMLSLMLCVGTADNDIGDEGAIRIAEGLEKNTSLIRLNLYRVFPPPSFFIHCWISHSFIS